MTIPVGSRPTWLAFLLPLMVICTSMSGVLVHLSQSAENTDYYVDGARGSDLNPGTVQHPWRTIQKAANTVLAGETVHVLPGNYLERVRVTTPGRDLAPIIFQAEGEVTLKGFTVLADHITIRGFSITGTEDLWDDGVGIFVAASHCVLEDNYVYYATRGGILLFGGEQEEQAITGCVVRNNRLRRNGLVGIEIHGRNHLVEGNEIWDTIQYHPLWEDPPDWVDADGIRFFGEGHQIRGNYIHDIAFDDPANRNPHIDCFQTWGPARRTVLEENRCEALEYQAPDEQGKGFMLESRDAPVQDLIIRNNVVVAFNHVTVLGGTNIQIVNNTFVSDLAFTARAQAGVGLFRSSGTVIKNNIFYDVYGPHLTFDVVSRRGLSAGYNQVFHSDGRRPQGEPRPGDLWAVDPLFVDAQAGDFRLAPASPAVDAGTNLDVTRDLQGTLRPQGAALDLGAYELKEGSEDPSRGAR